MAEYWLISAPGDKTCQQTWETMNNVTNKQNNLCENFKFHIPDLKVGTLDQLVGLSDDLGKLDTYVEGVCRKLAQYLGEVLEDSRDKLQENLLANNIPNVSGPGPPDEEPPGSRSHESHNMHITAHEKAKNSCSSCMFLPHRHNKSSSSSYETNNCSSDDRSPTPTCANRNFDSSTLLCGKSDDNTAGLCSGNLSQPSNDHCCEHEQYLDEWWSSEASKSNRGSHSSVGGLERTTPSSTHRSSPVSCCGSHRGRTSPCYEPAGSWKMMVDDAPISHENHNYGSSYESITEKAVTANCHNHTIQNTSSITYRTPHLSPLCQADLATYITRFQWDMAKYPTKQSLRNIADIISKQTGQIEADLKTKAAAYNSLKGNLQNLEKKQTGSLLTRNLADLVKKEHFILDSEYLTTLLVIIPRNAINDWNNNYEKITDMIVPRSTQFITQDNDYALFTVSLFKKVAEEFKLHAREKKFIVREFVYNEEELAAGKNEITKLVTDKKKQFGPLVRWLKVNFSECFCAWVHVKALRVFVESVLRYGLPVNFIAILIHPNKKSMKRLRDTLQQLYGHLDGSSAAGSASDNVDIPGLGFGQSEYFPYVYYKLNIDMIDNKSAI